MGPGSRLGGGNSIANDTCFGLRKPNHDLVGKKEGGQRCGVAFRASETARAGLSKLPIDFDRRKRYASVLSTF
jgi:hypothetical protein